MSLFYKNEAPDWLNDFARSQTDTQQVILNANNGRHLKSTLCTKHYACPSETPPNKVHIDIVLNSDMKEGPAPCISHTANECQRQDSTPGLSDSNAYALREITGMAVALFQRRKGHREVRLFAEHPL